MFTEKNNTYEVAWVIYESFYFFNEIKKAEPTSNKLFH